MRQVVDTLVNWINFELSDIEIRMSVANLVDDLRDGLVFSKLVGKLADQVIAMPFGSYAQATQRQYNNLQAVVASIMEILDVNESDPWYKLYYFLRSKKSYVLHA